MTGLTIWRDMTDAEKGALLLAAYEGRPIEYLSALNGNEWRLRRSCNYWYDTDVYRIASGLERRTVSLYGCGYEWGQASKPCPQDTHRITYNTIGGQPDCASVAMERLT
jgi:hypothetical protein